MSGVDRVDWNELINEQQDKELTGIQSSSEEEEEEGLRTFGRYKRHRRRVLNHSVNMSDNCESDVENVSCVIVEQPQSSPEVERNQTSEEESYSNQEEEENTNVLDLYCEEYDAIGQEELGKSVRYTEPIVTSSEDVKPVTSSNATDRSDAIDKRTYKRSSQCARKRRRSKGQLLDRQKRSERETFHNRDRTDPFARHTHLQRSLRERRTADDNTKWTVQWVRKGYDDLIYDICNCNEAPNVVFAGLCYRQSDVYTMVLRNCDGKRRYWYDKSSRRKELRYGERVGVFERAIRSRASTIGRVSTSPGYDLAAFVLQNVTTDKRCFGASTSATTPLILVTEDNMLSDPSIHGQLLYTRKNDCLQFERQTATSYLDYRQQSGHGRVTCRACGRSPGVVTHDSGSVPVFTCWQHSASYMTDADADSTHVFNAVVVDMRFYRDDNSPEDELVCRLSLVNRGRSEIANYTTKGNHIFVDNCSALTIAEFVRSPFDVHQRPPELTTRDPLLTPESSTGLRPVDLKRAHESTCRDRHYNVEDLFPSLTTATGTSRIGGVHYYDTTIGRVVDRIHCIACNFQS